VSKKEQNQPAEAPQADLATKVDELTADLQRVQADFVNFRRRSDEERSSFMDLAKQDIILQLLPMLDNIDRALRYLPENLKDDAWAKGVSQIAKQADDTIRGLGLERIQSLHQPFDPHLHEAIGGDGEVVVEELQPGYKLGNRVIRHAMVKVGRK
jgi:molecular chaperone GrpE